MWRVFLSMVCHTPQGGKKPSAVRPCALTDPLPGNSIPVFRGSRGLRSDCPRGFLHGISFAFNNYQLPLHVWMSSPTRVCVEGVRNSRVGRGFMSPVDTRSANVSLTLTAEERSELLAYLEQGLRDVLVEVHRTESPEFRELVERKERALRSVIEKLRSA